MTAIERKRFATQQWREKHRKHVRKYDHDRYVRNQDGCKDRMLRRYYDEVSTPIGRVRYLLHGAKTRANRRNVEFSISIDNLLPLPTACPVFGLKLDYTASQKRGRHPTSASIDRKNPAKGYIPGNVWVISSRANTIKNDGTAAEHRAIAEAMEGVVQ